MTITLADPRQDAWARRKIEQGRLATFRTYRASICGLSCCNDGDKAKELDGLIKDCLKRIAVLEDRICTRSHASLPA